MLATQNTALYIRTRKWCVCVIFIFVSSRYSSLLHFSFHWLFVVFHSVLSFICEFYRKYDFLCVYVSLLLFEEISIVLMRYILLKTLQNISVAMLFILRFIRTLKPFHLCVCLCNVTRSNNNNK